MIYSKEDRYVETIDTTNLFIQAPIDRKPVEGKIRIKIKGVLMDMLLQIYPGKCGPGVVYEKLNKVLYIRVLKSIYVMIQ